MSAIVGERDKALQATIPRNLNPTAGKSLDLNYDPPAFHQNSAGIPTFPAITFTAVLNGFVGTVLWSITSGGKLTGSTPNVRTLLFSDMTADSVKVTITIVSEGQAYIAVRTIYKMTDGAPGKDADPADIDLSPEHLAELLEGQITESQLYADLKSKIDLITDPVTVPGSVQALIKAETDGRVAAIGVEVQTRQQAIDQEVSDRIAAVLAEAGARTTYIQNYTFSQQQINSALSIQATQIAAGYTAYVDQKTGTILSTAAADVRNYSYAKADTDSAISAAETRLRSEFNSAGGVTMADVQNWSYSKAATDSAESAQTASITSSFQGYADQKKSEAVTAAAADVRNYAYSKSAVDAAEAAQSSTLTTNYTAYADSARANAISTASADVRSYAYSKSTVDSSISSAIQQLRSEFVGSGGATEGYVTNYAYSRSDIDAAEALQSSTLTTSYTSAINAIKIGGRNLFSRTQQFSDPTSSGSIVAERYPYVTADAFTLVGVSGSTGFQRMAVALSAGPYTLSFNLRNRDYNGPISIDLADTTSQVVNATKVDTRYELHFTVTNAGLAWLDFDKMNSQAYYFSKFMLVSGTKAFDYSPAPEDVAGDISAAITTAAADVRQYAYSKSGTDGAISSLSTQLTASYTTYADSGKAAAIAAAAADVRNYTYAKADITGAIAQSTSSLTTTVAGHTTTLQTQGTSINGLSAQYTVKIDANGYVTGFGLASSIATGAPTSVFIVNAGAFSVVAPGGTPQPMFTVGQVNGQTVAVLRGTLIGDKSIFQSQLVVGGSPDNIIPDPSFNDLAWWGQSATGAVATHFTGATAWTTGSSLTLSSLNVQRDATTQSFPMTPGATYRVEYQVDLSSDFAGSLSVCWLIPGVQWNAMGGPDKGAWSDGLRINFDGTSTKGFQPFSATYTVPTGGSTSTTSLRLRHLITSGSATVGGFSITRMSDTVLIKDGAITASKITVDKVQAISSIIVARVGATGAGVDLDVNGARTYDTNSIKRFQWGNLDV